MLYSVICKSLFLGRLIQKLVISENIIVNMQYSIFYQEGGGLAELLLYVQFNTCGTEKL